MIGVVRVVLQMTLMSSTWKGLGEAARPTDQSDEW